MIPFFTLAVQQFARLLCKLVNAGQTCVAPDYILCTKETQEKLMPILEKILGEFCDGKPKESDSYSRTINERHFQRLVKLLGKSNVAIGGETDAETK